MVDSDSLIHSATAALYLDYLLFRYFQYAFHLDDSFQIWRKSTEEIQAMLYVLGRMRSIMSTTLPKEDEEKSLS